MPRVPMPSRRRAVFVALFRPDPRTSFFESRREFSMSRLRENRAASVEIVCLVSRRLAPPRRPASRMSCELARPSPNGLMRMLVTWSTPLPTLRRFFRQLGKLGSSELEMPISIARGESVVSLVVSPLHGLYKSTEGGLHEASRSASACGRNPLAFRGPDIVAPSLQAPRLQHRCHSWIEESFAVGAMPCRSRH